MAYLNFGEKKVNINNPEEIISAYNEGFVATRKGPGELERVRSVRINLHQFELSSENRRILRKFEHKLELNKLPYQNYTWEIHKLGKDFYDTKFGKDTFSANKIKEIFTEVDKNSFNLVLVYINPKSSLIEGYCVALEAESSGQKIIHYSYPFYKLDLINSSFGIFMMTMAINHFKEQGYDYIYLGSAHSSESKYKLQFKGLEWWDEQSNNWSSNLDEIKLRINIKPVS